MDKPLVTIYCATFNHENYIRDAIGGFLSQKVSFPIEIIINDDCSTDSTADIVREYEQKYPDIFKPIYQTENQYSKGKSILHDIVGKRARGKYIAVCEGDDYWTDENKLQTQVDFLEAHPDCVMTHHNAMTVKMDKTEIAPVNAFAKEGFVSVEEQIEERLGWVATATIVFRAEFLKEYPPQFKRCPVGDYPLRVFMATRGKVYYFDKIMSAYRVSTGDMRSTSSVTDTNLDVKTIEKKEKYELAMARFFKDFDEFTDYKYTESVQRRCSPHLYSYYLRHKKRKELVQLYYYKQLPFKSKLNVFLFFYAPHIHKLLHK